MSDEKKENRESLIGGKSLLSVGGLALVLCILILINLIFSQVNLRWDTTSDKLYSLSDGTKDILAQLDQEVTIRVFYTKENVNTPVHIKTYAQRMLDFLSEYEHYSRGKVTVEIHDTQPDSDEEDWARSYGIEGMNFPTGDRIYLGLVALAADQEEVIKMVDPSREAQLEYDITRMITRVQSPEKKKIGIISSLPVFGGPPVNMQMPTQTTEPWLFITELRKSYDVEEIATSAKEIDGDVDLLILLHPKEMSDLLQYAVDQYVLKGGNAIVFADPLAVGDAPGPQGMPQPSVPDKLFSAWGIKMEKNKVVADFDYATRLRNQQNQVEDNPLWLSLKSEGVNADDITTAKLESILLPVAGALEKDPESDVEYKSLLKSSSNSALTESFRIRFGAQQLRRDFKATIDQYDLAARIRGTFKTAFPNGKPQDKDDKEKDKEKGADNHLAESENKSVVVVVSDADMLMDDYYVSKQRFLGFNLSRIFNDNLNFLLNTTEMLTGSEALIGIRSRGKFGRPFTKVQELEKKAQARWLLREQELVRKADETNRKLREFEKQKDKSQRFIMTPEQEAEIKQFREEKQRVNQELKQVRRNLRADIESLGSKVKFFNIFLMPMLVALAGIAYAIYRRNRSLAN